MRILKHYKIIIMHNIIIQKINLYVMNLVHKITLYQIMDINVFQMNKTVVIILMIME